MSAPGALAAWRDQLKAWMLGRAFPLWWRAGADRHFGGFHDRLDLAGRPVVGPKRARVQARQVFCYALAPMLGWRGPAAEATRHGLEFLSSRHRRPDGLYRRRLPAGGGGADDDAIDLYDQAFVLLALASARPDGAERQAEALVARLTPDAGGGFGEFAGDARLANPNMHLFEAFLAWMEAGGGSPWRTLAAGQAALAVGRLIDPDTGAVSEAFDEAWRAPTPVAARRVEPGHQFEWAWLLMRWSVMAGDPQALAAALRLLEIGEARGVDSASGLVVNALDGALTVVDSGARLWPQTERLKAAALAVRLTGDQIWWRTAERAAVTLDRFLAVATPGLWRDRVSDGDFVEEAAPASSFYHIVGAVLELDRAVRG